MSTIPDQGDDLFMGFSFRRSASFGPLRLNFSKSGIGASVGVKGARFTMTPRGRTYITVGAAGFSYRHAVSNRNRPPALSPQQPTRPTGSHIIETADVEELCDSSQSELVDNLNRRAAMFNPAIIVFLIAALSCVAALLQLAAAVPASLPPLPEVDPASTPDRQANNIDEYAVLLARYGQPTDVQVNQAGSVPTRDATWHTAHVTVRLVPAGCVTAYRYFESHRNDPPPVHVASRHLHTGKTLTAAAPTCKPGNSNASTIVAYQDAQSFTPLDSRAADYLFSSIVPSGTPPQVSETRAVAATDTHGTSTPAVTISYEQPVLQSERSRLRELDVAGSKHRTIGVACVTIAFALLIVGLAANRRNKQKRTTQLIYDLPQQAQTDHQHLERALDYLGNSMAIWRLASQSTITDWKRNAGAAYNVQRERVALRRAVPARVESNLTPLCLDLGKVKLFFLADQILYCQRGTFASIDYNDLKISTASTQFIETAVQTSDSQQIGTTWRYVRKDGGPDRRFNNNQQLPIMRYGVVHATSAGGLNLLFHTSLPTAATSFDTAFRAFWSNRASTRTLGSE